MSRSKLAILLIIFLALWLRVPFIYSGLPYFSDEDEAHHHNRVVNMVKQGDFNPHYFHKPSLHFYLRMPIISAAFLWSVRAQEIQKVSEINTSDPYGIAGYSFSAYPERILIWDRAFSVALSLLAIYLVYLIAIELGLNSVCASTSALIAAIAPAAVSGAATVAVDVVMTAFCLATTYIGLRTHARFTTKGLIETSLLAGLAISSKYNALPIIMVPLVIVALSAARKLSSSVVALSTCALGFLVGSPFILVSLPLFLDQFAYEIWHYGIAGHVGHEAEPGLAQLRFYLKWLIQSGIGWFGFFAALALLLQAAQFSKRALITVAFPACYFALMISQRANFTRNMLVLIPYCSIAVAAGVVLLAHRVSRSVPNIKRNWSYSICIAIVALPLIWQSFSLRRAANNLPETRKEVSRWLEDQAGEIAVAGQLQIAQPIIEQSRAERVNYEKTSVAALFQMGFERVVLPKGAYSDSQLNGLKLEKSYPGEAWPQRVVVNPAIDIFSFNLPIEVQQSLANTESVSIDSNANLKCAQGDLVNEGHCWLNQRIVSIGVQPHKFSQLSLQVMSPWPKQEIGLIDGDGKQDILIKAGAINPGQWHKLEITPNQLNNGKVILVIGELHVPAKYKMGEDKRRLGLAVKSAEFK